MDPSGTQDSRAYYTYLDSLSAEVDSGSTEAYLEHAGCTIADFQSYQVTVTENNVWNCGLALPETTSTIDGEAPFDLTNGLVIKGYYIANYIPDDGTGQSEQMAFQTATQLFFAADDGATAMTTYAAAVIAAIAAFLY